MKLQQGIRRLILIQSGSHRFSVFPIDQPLSIYGRNNMGKSQSINALQFLMFRHAKMMDFGAYDNAQSKEFYFKTDYSMIVMEIMVNEGVFLIGAAGKGPLHQYEYEHFLIKTHYKKSDFFDGENHLKAKEVFSKFEKRGVPVQLLTREQLSQALTGNYHAAGIKHDITLVPIREATESRVTVFNQLFRNLLTMKKISDREIKSLVLEVFSNVLANIKVDFMQVKGEAFRSYDDACNEIQTIKENEEEILKLTAAYNKREDSRKHLVDIKTRLRQICQAKMESIPSQLADTNDAKVQKELLLSNSKPIFDKLLEEQQTFTIARSKVETFFEELNKQKDRFSLCMQMHDNDQQLYLAKLADSINDLHTERSILSQNIERSSRRTVSAVSNDISNQESRIADLENELERHLNQDSWMHELGYSNDQKQQLSRVLSPKFMSLPKSCIMAAAEKLPNVFDAAFEIDGNQFISDSLTLNISGIRGQVFKDANPEEISMQIESAKEYLDQLMAELNVATDVAAARESLLSIDASIKKETAEQRDFESYIQNLKEEPLNAERLDEYVEATAELKERLRNESDRNTQIKTEIEHLNEKLHELGLEMQTIRTVAALAFYRDPQIEFLESDLLDGNVNVDNDAIVAMRDEGESYYGKFRGSAQEFEYSRDRIFQRFSKHSAEQYDDKLVAKLNQELESIPEKETFLTKLHHEAIIKLASALNNLSKNYQRLEGQVSEFNRKINGKKVSNLKSFKLRLLPNQKALDAIATLMSSIESDGLDLFSQSSEKKMDMAVSNDAINYLSDMVKQLGGVSLTLSELFELGFEIIDVNDVMSTYTSLDGHASNGTTMTMKALFNMNLIRFLYDNRQTIHLPFYVDEATNIDDNNRLSLIAMSHDLGFTPIFASVDPIITAKYNINLEEAVTDHGLIVPEESWIRIADKEEAPAEDQLELM